MTESYGSAEHLQTGIGRQTLRLRSVANDKLAIGVMRVLNMLFVCFKIGCGIPAFLNMIRGGSTLCCRPLITLLQRRARLSTAGEAHSS